MFIRRLLSAVYANYFCLFSLVANDLTRTTIKVIRVLAVLTQVIDKCVPH